MTPELTPGAIDDDTLACSRAAAGEKRRMITVGHEADLVTVGFLGNPETELTRMLAHLHLVERANRKYGVRKLRLCEREEKVQTGPWPHRRREATGIFR